MTAMGKLIVVEGKLLVRDWTVLTFGLAFPTVLLLVLGSIFPGFLDPNPDFDGLRTIDVYAPVMIMFVFVMVGVGSLPGFLASYRERAILRRLQVTPLGPARLLVAQLVCHLTVGLLGTTAAVVVAVSVFEVPRPGSWPGLAAGVALTAVVMLAIGLLLGARLRKTSSSSAVSTVTWLPLMLLAGLWFPREVMPDGLRTVSDWSPAGAGVAAIQGAWIGGGAPLTSLAVMAGFAVIAGVGAVVLFRWE